MKKYYSHIILLAILAFAAVLRFSTMLFHRDYWYDEAFTGILLKASWGQMNQMIFADVHPPLYYWLAKLWSIPFQYSPAGIRAFSLLMGVLSVVSVFWIGKKMFNDRAGLLAAAIIAISPFAIEYSQEARMYALFGLLMLWAVWFFYQALQNGRMRDWALWGLFGGLSFYTHYLSLFFFVIFYLAYILNQKLKTKVQQSKAKNKKNVYNLKDAVLFFFPEKGFWLGVGIIIIFFLSWVKIFMAHISKGNLGWIEPTQISEIPKTLQIFFFGHPAGTGGMPWANEFRYFFDGTSVGLLILALILILFTASWIRKIKRPEIMLLATISFGTLFFLIFLSHGIDLETNGQLKNISVKLYVARYFMPAAILVYLLIAGLITEVFDNRVAWVLFIAVYALMILGLKPMDYNQGWALLYEEKSLLPEQALIIASNPFDYSTARYYFGEERVKYYNKNNPSEDFAGWVVVGNQNRITDFEEIRKNPQAFIIDNDCNWEGKRMIKIGQPDQLSICKAF